MTRMGIYSLATRNGNLRGSTRISNVLQTSPFLLRVCAWQAFQYVRPLSPDDEDIEWWVPLSERRKKLS